MNWTCEQCGENNEKQLSACGSCGKSSPDISEIAKTLGSDQPAPVFRLNVPMRMLARRAAITLQVIVVLEIVVASPFVALSILEITGDFTAALLIGLFALHSLILLLGLCFVLDAALRFDDFERRMQDTDAKHDAAS